MANDERRFASFLLSHLISLLLYFQSHMCQRLKCVYAKLNIKSTWRTNLSHVRKGSGLDIYKNIIRVYNSIKFSLSFL